MTALTFDIHEAAKRLGGPFTVDFLRGHLSEIPHIRTGKGTGRSGRVSFTDNHLERIVLLFTVNPEEGSEPGDFPSRITRRSPRRRTGSAA